MERDSKRLPQVEVQDRPLSPSLSMIPLAT